mmetsp:Transcript_36391/g.145412  ORF Transcript_36391/g.145412 Transcript_36391/m.145412 type:complete len:683 (+) Transcript_36391:604-2652(+)
MGPNSVMKFRSPPAVKSEEVWFQDNVPDSISISIADGKPLGEADMSVVDSAWLNANSLAVAKNDGMVDVYNVHSQKLVTQFRPYMDDDPVQYLASLEKTIDDDDFEANLLKIATVSGKTRTVRMWELDGDRAELIRSIVLPKDGTEVAMSIPLVSKFKMPLRSELVSKPKVSREGEFDSVLQAAEEDYTELESTYAVKAKEAEFDGLIAEAQAETEAMEANYAAAAAAAAAAATAAAAAAGTAVALGAGESDEAEVAELEGAEGEVLEETGEVEEAEEVAPGETAEVEQPAETAETAKDADLDAVAQGEIEEDSAAAEAAALAAGAGAGAAGVAGAAALVDDGAGDVAEAVAADPTIEQTSARAVDNQTTVPPADDGGNAGAIAGAAAGGAALGALGATAIAAATKGGDKGEEEEAAEETIEETVQEEAVPEPVEGDLAAEPVLEEVSAEPVAEEIPEVDPNIGVAEAAAIGGATAAAGAAAAAGVAASAETPEDEAAVTEDIGTDAFAKFKSAEEQDIADRQAYEDQLTQRKSVPGGAIAGGAAAAGLATGTAAAAAADEGAEDVEAEYEVIEEDQGYVYEEIEVYEPIPPGDVNLGAEASAAAGVGGAAATGAATGAAAEVAAVAEDEDDEEIEEYVEETIQEHYLEEEEDDDSIIEEETVEELEVTYEDGVVVSVEGTS